MPRFRCHLALLGWLAIALPALAAGQPGAPRKATGLPAPLPPPLVLRRGWRLLPDLREHYSVAHLPARGWRPVQVGLSIQAQFVDLRNFAGAAWYRRTLTLAPLPAGDHWLLRIGACDYRCAVFFNGRRLAVHDGGYLPFAVDLTAAAHPGRNQLLIRIADPPGPEAKFKTSYAQIPHGKQNWYVQTSGLWQRVTLAAEPVYYIAWAHVLTRGRDVTGLRLDIVHARRVPPGARATVAIFGPGGRPELKAGIPLRARPRLTLTLAMRGQWWSPRHPRLYRFTVTLPDGARYSGHFGLRTIATRGGRMYLNGQLFYIRGALDQAFYPRGIYSPPSLAYLEREMRAARALGLNTLRLHIKVPDPRYLQAADRTGMLVWYEIPNWDTLTPLSERRAKTTLRRMIARDWNHPSLILQSIVNESWGVNLRVAWQRRWLHGMFLWARRRLPDRLVDDNTACCANFHIQTGLADFHNYDSIPDHAAAWDRFVRAFAARPKWLYSPYGDADPTDAPLVVSEFGNWGLPLLPPKRPWWFTRGFGGNPITVPAGVDQRLRRSALAGVFPSYAALARAAEWHEWQALRYEIESLRRHPAIQGYVITELTDVNWESNGLLTMWRRPKVFAGKLAALQKSVIVMAEPDQPDYPPGATARVTILVSNESPLPFAGGEVAVAGRRYAVPVLASGAVERVAMARVSLRRAPAAAEVARGNENGALAQARTPAPLRGASFATAARTLAPRPGAPPRGGRAVFSGSKVGAKGREIPQGGPRPSMFAGPVRAWQRTLRFRLIQGDHTVDARALRIGVIGGQRGQGIVRLLTQSGRGWRTLARRLAAHGYRVLPATAAGGVLLTPVWPLPAGIRAASRVLVLADSAAALSAPGPERIVARHGNLSGDWISNFNWVNTSRPPFAFLRGFNPVLGREAAAVTPRFLLRPPPRADTQAELAGFFLGWVHASHALAIQARQGRSRLFVTTFRLAPAYGRDALATGMLNAILGYMRTPGFQPRWRWH